MKKETVYLKVIIADDHPFFRDGMEIALKKISCIKKITHASNGKEVLRILKNERHHIVFMDIKMPVMNGIETTKIISKDFPKVKVIALSMFDDKQHIVDMFDSGAYGYILKDSGQNEIESAIREVKQGKRYFSSTVSDELFRNVILKKEQTHRVEMGEQLSERETEILKLICRELMTKQIADKLCLSKKAVEKHRAELFRKAHVDNLAGLVKYAIRNGYCDEM